MHFTTRQLIKSSLYFHKCRRNSYKIQYSNCSACR